MGEILDVNYIFMCAAAPSTTSLDVSSSTSSTSSSMPSYMTSVIETYTSSAAMVSTASSMDNTLYEAA